MGTVVIENVLKGTRKTISQRTWDLMANSKERGDTRKGWRALKGVTATPAKSNPATVKTPTMIPPSIQAAADAALEAERKAEALMISGAKPEELGEAPAAEVAAPTQEAPQADAAPAEVEADLPTELAGLDESLTPKVAQVLAKAGIATKAQLKSATLPTVNKALDAAGLGAKKAQAAGWKSKVATPKA